MGENILPLPPPPPPPPSSQITRTQTVGNLGESMMDSEVLPSSVVEIAPILRVANEIEPLNPRVAYLCHLHAFEKAHILDPTSSGRGVRQFKTVLLQRLEKENDITLKGRKDNDTHEMKSLYRDYYRKYIQALQDGNADSAQLKKVYQTASILFDVLKATISRNSGDVTDEILEVEENVKEKMDLYVPFNILPLDPESSRLAIMRYPEIKASVTALRNTRGLPWPEGHKNKVDEDILDWLQAMFGFQRDNVSNQREHLILLLANVHVPQFRKPASQPKLDDHALAEVMKKLLKNYKKWCKYLGRKSSIWLPTVHKELQLDEVHPDEVQHEEVQQRKLLYIGLYLLIWGEAANLRFMPECLCYIYHHMAFELYGMLDRKVSPITGESIKPAYGNEEEAFLAKVVTPIYNTTSKEARESRGGKSKHSHWRNYDDLNEYFWSVDCFRLGWPMRTDADFFCHRTKHLQAEKKDDNNPTNRDQWVGKIDFVETRSFWHIYRSFNRMWSFFVLSLQAMIIIAWNESGQQSSMFERDTFKKVLSIFITAAVLELAQAVLDIIMSWRARHRMTCLVQLRYVLKAVTAAAWVIILPITYGSSKPSLFLLVVLIYLSSNMLSVVLFLFPFIRGSLESSEYKVVKFIKWWSQPLLYVGRGMQENAVSVFKYTMFWVLLIVAKLAFSYYVEIKPLVGPTKAIMRVDISAYNEFFPLTKSNIGVVIALWAPIILVYFMDTQIWYAIFSTIVGGLYGAFLRLGEIRTLGMLMNRFESFPDAFNLCLIPTNHRMGKWLKFTSLPQRVMDGSKERQAAKFAQLWNKIITNFREEDLISNREMILLLLPNAADRVLDLIQWPPFLLANKLPVALDLATNSNGMDYELKKRLATDNYMQSAINECYASVKSIILHLIRGQSGNDAIYEIFCEVDRLIDEDDLITELNMTALPSLYYKVIELIELLEKNDNYDKDKVVIVLLDMLEVVTRDIMKETSLLHSSNHASYMTVERITPDQQHHFFNAIAFPVSEGVEAWKEKIRRLHILLTEKETATDVPSNLEARRRLSFLSNSLFMEMPAAPKVRDMLSFSVLTPYFKEDVLFSLNGLKEPNEDGISIIFYLQKIFPDEWNNFLERVNRSSEEELKGNPYLEEELCLWASYRGQTLTKTDLMEGYKATELDKEQLRNQTSLLAQCHAVADMKFSFVVSCQRYGIDKRIGDPRAQDILRLMTKYPSLRVAYIDEVEEIRSDRSEKVYYSALVKAAPKSIGSSDQGQNLDQVIYQIKLPGPPILGEGKPENQNHAIIFTRGEGLQTIDMNQDNYLEEALKMRNLLQEFKKQQGAKNPTILGLREHIFTGSVSSLAWFMSNQETSFVTIGQRLLTNPLKVRFHYGHPDVFDRLFHLTRGGVSKASKTINLSEDIFAGFNSTLRGGNVTYHEYIQVGKGRDMGLNQISLFEAKIANGNGEQAMSRDIYRLGHRFDFFRMLSCYFTTIGFYFSAMLTVLTVYVFLYGRLYLSLSGLEQGLRIEPAIRDNKPLQVALASQSFVQMGLLTSLPMVMEIGLERGFPRALTDFIVMQLQLAPVFFTFSLGTKIHYFGRTLLHGGAQYRGTGRGFVVFRAKFAENYRLYSRSHFVKGIELMILLIVYHMFSESYRGAVASLLITISIWFMVLSWLFAPFIFNPSGFEWHNIFDDWTDWNKWMGRPGGIGLPAEKSWESWWEKEQEHLRYTGKRGTICEILLSLRFFIYQYGLVYHLSITNGKSLLVYGVSWVVIFVILLLIKGVSLARKKYSSNSQLVFRAIKTSIFLGVFASIITLMPLAHFTFRDFILCILALMPTGWGLLQIAQASRKLVTRIGIWDLVETIAFSYETIMGLVVFAPVAFLAWFPFVSEFQTRMLFNQAFSRGLQISRILGGQRTDQSSNKKE